jgi:origin recognition complex subunit 5
MPPLFRLPPDLLTTIVSAFPCRELQIRSLATLLYPCAAPVRNLVVHGVEATGKSAITAQLLAALQQDPDSELHYAFVRSAECVTGRHLFERTIASVADALQWGGPAPARCENMAALTVELCKLLRDANRPVASRFVLVFDGIDHQREPPPTLLPALARLSEIVRSPVLFLSCAT